MYANDENSERIRKGKRRSSILKNPKSPGYVLDDIDPNTQNVDETVQRSKKARRSSSRRVSFAEKCQIKEIPNEALGKMLPMNPDDLLTDENGPSESTCDNSLYRPPAATLVGLSSLLTSPIQESPPNPGFCQFSPDETQLDFTCYQDGFQDNSHGNQTQDVMEMTKNYGGWEFKRSTVLTSLSSKCLPEKDDGQLDFTRSHGAYMDDNEPNTTVPGDGMEMTRNYEGWELEQSAVLTRQFVSSKVAMSNQGQIPKLDESSFVEEFQANESISNRSFEMRNSFDKQNIQRSKPQPSPKRNGASFLDELRTSSCRSQERDKYSYPFLAEAHPTTSLQPIVEGDELEFTQCLGGNIRDSHVLNTSSDDEVSINPMEMTRNYEGWLSTSRPKPAQSPDASFLSRLTTTSKSSNYQQQGDDYDNPTFVKTPLATSNLHNSMRSTRNEDKLDLTRFVGGNIEHERTFVDNDDTCDQMEMTKNYENWQKENSTNVPHSQTLQKENIAHSTRSPEKDDSLDFTRCHSANIVNSGTVDEDVTVNQMEMTRNYENWDIDMNKGSSPEKVDNVDFTRCQDGKIETLQCEIADKDVTITDQMEMTRNYENWEVERSNVAQLQSKTPRNDSDTNQKVSQRAEEVSNVQSSCLEDDLELTGSMKMPSAVDSGVLNESLQISHAVGKLKPDEKLNVSLRVQMSENQVPVVKPRAADEKMSVSRDISMSENQASIAKALPRAIDEKMNVSSRVETSENHVSMIKAIPRATDKMKVSTHVQVSKNQVSMVKAIPRATDEKVSVSRDVKISENEVSMVKAIPRAPDGKVSVSRDVQIPENQASVVKAVPRTTASRMDMNFQRFEIKLPTARIGKVPVYKFEEKSAVELQPELNSVSKAPSFSLSQEASSSPSQAPISSLSQAPSSSLSQAQSSSLSRAPSSSPIQAPSSSLSQAPSSSLSQAPSSSLSQAPSSSLSQAPSSSLSQAPSSSLSQAPSSSLSQTPYSSLIQTPRLPAQDMTIATTGTVQSSQEVVKKEPEDIENEALAKIFNEREQSMTSTESAQPEANYTTIELGQIKSEVESEEEHIAEDEALEVPYTLKDFMFDAGISFLHYVTRRSETPMFERDIPKELKDKILARCLSDAKVQIMEDFIQELQEEIAKNKKMFAAKEAELNANVPPIFGKLQKAIGTDDEDVVVEVIKQLHKVGNTRGKRLWYKKKKEMREKVLASLKEQETKLSAEVSLIQNHQSELDEDITMLEKVEADCDKQIEELEATLESDEKEWAEYVKDTAEIKQKLETLELELQTKEEERAQLWSVKECLTNEVAEQKTKIASIESDIEKLQEEKELRESKDKEMQKFLSFQTALQEWVLVKHDDTELNFTFLGQTLDLNVTFEDAEKIKDIQLISKISAELSRPLAILGHQLVMENFAQYDFLARFPTRNKLPQLLHEVSVACVRVRILLKTMRKVSINHFVHVSDKILIVEFSSQAKYMKFILNFNLSKLVTDDDIAFTVVSKIGTTSAEAITAQLNKFPPKIVYLKKILNAADQLLR